MASLRRILPVLLILGLALGTTAQAAWASLMADMPGMAAAVADHADMPDCQDCDPGQGTDGGMAMAGCQGGICIALPGVLPNAPDGAPIAPGAFSIPASTTANGLAPPPDHRPPMILVSLA